ncbi:MAG: RNA polymerase sigma factor, partial [Pirellulales bacterium]
MQAGRKQTARCDPLASVGNTCPGTAKGGAGRRFGQACTNLNVTELTDEQLAQLAAREGSDGPAFVAILDRFRQRVWSVCYRLMGNEHDASDAAQEVFVRLFVNRGKFEGRSKYSTWVHGVAVRTCLGIRRGRGRRQKHERVVGDEHTAPEALARPEAPAGLSLDLVQILDTLDEDDRALLLLKYAEGYSHEELAAIFEISVSACKMRISRAREKIQKQFQ